MVCFLLTPLDRKKEEKGKKEEETRAGCDYLPQNWEFFLVSSLRLKHLETNILPQEHEPGSPTRYVGDLAGEGSLIRSIGEDMNHQKKMQKGR